MAAFRDSTEKDNHGVEMNAHDQKYLQFCGTQIWPKAVRNPEIETGSY